MIVTIFVFTMPVVLVFTRFAVIIHVNISVSIVMLLTTIRIYILVIPTGFPPNGWTGPDSILYWGFDDLIGLNTMQGTAQATWPLVSGKVYMTETAWFKSGLGGEHAKQCACMHL